MRVPTLLTLLVAACLLGVTGIAVAGAADTAGDVESPTIEGQLAVESASLAGEHVAECAVESPADHAPPDGDTSDVVGWVDGYWYDEPLDIVGPTLTEDELDELVARTAARVEALRCLTFEEVPPTEMRTRDEHRDDIEAHFEAELTQADADFESARLATALVAGQSVDAVELQLDAQTAFPAAFYDVEEAFVGFITEDPDSIELDQAILAHELLHALQDQQFGLDPTFDEPTTDGFASSLSVIEGDAVLVEERYRENCETAAWVDGCLTQVPDEPDVPSWPLLLEQFAAYNTPLVETTYEDGGWEDVNALFDAMPASMVEAIYPDRYGAFERPELTVEDHSNDDWERIERENADYDILGQHFLTAILVAPFYESQGMTEIVDIDEFLVDPLGEDIEYGHPVTEGWQADRLYGYTDGEDTAGVWKLAWADTDEAGTFADAFEDLAEYRGATLAEGYDNVYTFEDSDEYDMALGLERDGDRLWVVTAPTVEELTAVHGAFDVDGDDGTDDGVDDGTDDSVDDGTDDGVDDGADDGTDDSTDDGTDSDTDADDDGAGFSVAVVVVATVAGLILARQRRR